jgi:MazG family protein
MSREINQLIRIMARLRSPKGCPWDREQNHQSLIPCLKNESKEVIDAIKQRDSYNLQEELGDLLLQVVFHAQLAREKGHFSFKDVVISINRKLIRRHPHVFGKKTKASDTAAVLKQWNEIKAKEKKDRRHARHKKPRALL